MKNQFTFAHFSDIHIGSWRDPRMRDFATQAFVKAMQECIKRQVDFILLSGDIFNTPMPPIDKLKTATATLKRLHEQGIPVYIIAGSHDYSPSGKTMLDVLEEAGLVKNVAKGEVQNDGNNKDNKGKLCLRFTIDEKTGAKITGILGKKGMLDRKYYEELDKTNLEAEQGYKIFMLHTALSEFKPRELEQMEAHPLSLLPKGFDYYAAGHVHYIFSQQQEEYGFIAYPGALFPCNFRELEQFGCGGGYFVNVQKNEQGGKSGEQGKIEQTVHWESMKVADTLCFSIDGHRKTPRQIEEELITKIRANEVYGKIVLIRIAGTLASGSLHDLDFSSPFSMLYERGAHFVMKNTAKLIAEDADEIGLGGIYAQQPEQIEEAVMAEYLGQLKLGLSQEEEKGVIHAMLEALATEKSEGETNTTFETRVKEEVGRVLQEKKVI